MQSITKKITPIKNCEIVGWQNVKELIHSFYPVAIWPVTGAVKVFKTLNDRQSGIFNKFDLSKGAFTLGARALVPEYGTCWALM